MTLCTARVHEGIWSGDCNREAKPGETLCGPHLAGKRRSEASDAKRAAQAKARTDKREVMLAKADRLKDEHGLSARIEYAPGSFAITDNLLVNADALLDLLDLLKGRG